MRADLLRDNFATLVKTPEDVKALESAILDLAMRGKLVSQDPNDEPAGRLLERIRAEKQRMVDKGVIRRSKQLPPVSKQELPYELPECWSPCRLGDIGDWGAGATPGRKEPSYWQHGTIPWLKTGELNDGFISQTEEHVTELALQKTSLRLCKPNDVLMAMYGATIGKLGILEIEATTNQACCACTPFGGVLNRYLYYYLLSMRKVLRAKGAGGAQPNISKTKIVHTVFPLPPTAEQKRIVARLDELFSQTRNLADELQLADDLLEPAAQAAFRTLVDAPDTAARREAWQRIADGFEALTSEPRTIDALKQTILDLAVRGLLVPQDPEDEPASAALRSASQQRNQQLGSGRDVKIAPDVEEPNLPAGWIWARLEALAAIAGGVTKGRNLANHQTEMVPYLRVANVQRGYLELSEIKSIEIKTGEQRKYALQDGDLLLTEGGDADKVGRSAIWHGEIAGCIHQNHIFRARMYSDAIAPEWVMACTSSKYGRGYFLRSAKQTTNLASINMRQLRSFPVAVPPKAEQKRILEKMHRLLSACDTLADELSKTEQARVASFGSILNGES